MITATAKPAKAKYKVIFVNNGCGWTIYQDAKMVGHITSGPDRNALASAKHWLKFALGGFTVAEIHKALEDKIDPKTGKQTVLAQGDRNLHGLSWMCVAVDQQGQVLVGTEANKETGGGNFFFSTPFVPFGYPQNWPLVLS